MDKAETMKLMALIVAAFPNCKLNPEDETQRAVWHDMLQDLPLNIAAIATKSMIATLKYPPSIADIREAVAKSQAEARGDLTAGEAWLKVRRALGLYSAWDADKARAMVGEKIWDVVRMVAGCWADLCESCDENIPARFERLYNAQAAREQYVAQIPAPVMDRLKAIGGEMFGMKMIGGESDGP